MTDLTHWLPSILALVGAAAAWGSARTDLRQIREVLTEHRRDVAAGLRARRRRVPGAVRR